MEPIEIPMHDEGARGDQETTLRLQLDYFVASPAIYPQVRRICEDTEEYRACVKQVKPSVRECLEAIKSAGGKTSLAHPYQIGIDDDALDTLVGNLVPWGLDAIECYYPRFTPAQQAFYLSLAEKYRLHVTGGSDFHGERVKPDISLAALALDLDWLE